MSDEIFKHQMKKNREKQTHIDNYWDKNSISLRKIEKMKNDMNKTSKNFKKKSRSKEIT
jgi:hypothetical protein